MLSFLRPGASAKSVGQSVQAAAASAGPATPTPAAAVPEQSLPARAVAQVVQEDHCIEGPGFEITRPFPTRKMKMFDPWLLFDAFGPKMTKPGDPGNVRTHHLGQHPHRGFQAITFMVDGSFDHYDSTGKHGRLMPGSVQVMTAGGGIVHGGAPTREVELHGGPSHGYQLWLALPAAERMCPAGTVDFHANETPVVASEDGGVRARVLSSPLPVLGSTTHTLPTRQPIVMVHFVLQPGAAVTQPVPADFECLVHVSIGEGRFGPAQVPAQAEQCVLFQPHSAAAAAGSGASTIDIMNPGTAHGPLDVLLLGGVPTGDTIVQYGPFVGGSMADIQAAQRDFNQGLMGALAPDGKPSRVSAWA